ncbi:MAG: helix-turn-helix transcriptional regulator [Chitinophagaceae bacterium]
MKNSVPVYDIQHITNENRAQDLLVERFSDYINKHYDHLRRPHGHSFYHLAFFTAGSGYHTIDFTQFDVKKYQLYFMVPGQVHSWHFKNAVEGFIVHFSETFFKSFLADQQYINRFTFFSGNSEDGVVQLPVSLQQPVVKLFENMLQEKQQAAEGYTDLIRLLLLQVFTLVERGCAKDNKYKHPPQKLLLLKNFQQLIEQNYRTLKLPKEYATLLYITPNHLNALCQDLLGKTAGEIIRDRIILEAKRLLANADMTIAEIAWNLQFKDNSYFNRFFKKDAGITPEEFRKQLFTDK